MLNLFRTSQKQSHSPFSKVSYATSSNNRCAGSMPAASLAVMEKKGASKRDGSSFRKNPLSWLICSTSQHLLVLCITSISQSNCSYRAFTIMAWVLPRGRFISAGGDLSMSSASLAKHLPEILDRASASRKATSDSDDRNCIQHRVGGIHGWSAGHLVCV